MARVWYLDREEVASQISTRGWWVSEHLVWLRLYVCISAASSWSAALAAWSRFIFASRAGFVVYSYSKR